MANSEAITPPSTPHDIIVIGASSSGSAALKTIVKGLPADLPTVIFIVHYVSVAALQNQGIS